MTKATAAITDRFKNTYVRTEGTNTTDLQKAFFQMGFKWGWHGKDRIVEHDAEFASYIRVDDNCFLHFDTNVETPGANCIFGYEEVSALSVIEAAEQVRKIKRQESKASKKRRALRKWDATAIKRTTETCPVSPDTVISTRLNDGEVLTHRADWFEWESGPGVHTERDIASYKVLKQRKSKPRIITQDAMVEAIAADLGKSVAMVEVTDKQTGLKHLEIDNGQYDKPDTNPKRQYGVSSIPLNMWSPLASAYGALGLYNGSLKYGKANFANTPVEASIYIAAAMRHLLAWACGQEDDPADGVPNLGGVLANVAILLESRAAGMLIDDRLLMTGYLKEIDMLKEKVKALNELHAGKTPKHYTREV